LNNANDRTSKFEEKSDEGIFLEYSTTSKPTKYSTKRLSLWKNLRIQIPRLFAKFCDESGFQHIFSSPYTPEQNGVVERKNKSLQEMTRTLLIESNISSHFWAEAVSIACYIINKVFLRHILEKTPYELFKGKKPIVSYFHVFGCKCFVLKNANDRSGKFEEKLDE